MESDASSQDFTARRVIDKPEPGEPEGPVTAAKNETTSAMREALGLDAFDSPERRTWQAQLDNAVAKKIHERALDISSSVVARPRALSAEEQAGMVYRLMELDNQKRALKEKIAGTTDEGSLLSLHATDDRATSEIDVITTALNKGGSDIGRALNIRKMLLADDFSIIGIRNKVKKYELQSGKKIDPEQMKELEALAERFESMTKRMEKAAQDSIDSAAESTLKRHAASKRGIPKEAREKIIIDLAANVRQLIESGCR